MKTFAKFALFALLLSVVYGCASNDQVEIKLPPPEKMNPIFLKYKGLPGQKVFVVAIDPMGRWAYGYDYGKETLEEAAGVAATRCDRARQKHKVFTKGKLFAVNNEIVYYDN
jgi:hypothetical protein